MPFDLSIPRLYAMTGAIAFAATLAAVPAVRWAVRAAGMLDVPYGEVKTHKVATPVGGGIAVFLGFALALAAVRFATEFPTGTLRNLRGILFGAALVFGLGLWDDALKPRGLGVAPKFAVEFAAGLILFFFGIHIQFLEPRYLAVLVSLVWVAGVTNALNIIDIMDGFSASQAACAALAFLWIALPSEDIYVNFASAALLGASLGYLPYNFSTRGKIFLGDSGSLFLGFTLAAISLGTDYSRVNPLGVYAPIFILGVPLYDTFYVMLMRVLRRRSPFEGSRDHFALRLEALGFSRPQVVAFSAGAALFLSFCAYLATRLPLAWAMGVYFILAGEIVVLSRALSRVKV